MHDHPRKCNTWFCLDISIFQIIVLPQNQTQIIMISLFYRNKRCATITKKSLQCLESKPLMEYTVINFINQRLRLLCSHLSVIRSVKISEQIWSVLFSTVDNGDVNIHKVSVRGQLLHTSTCDTFEGICLSRNKRECLFKNVWIWLNLTASTKVFHYMIFELSTMLARSYLPSKELSFNRYGSF